MVKQNEQKSKRSFLEGRPTTTKETEELSKLMEQSRILNAAIKVSKPPSPFKHKCAAAAAVHEQMAADLRKSHENFWKDADSVQKDKEEGDTSSDDVKKFVVEKRMATRSSPRLKKQKGEHKEGEKEKQAEDKKQFQEKKTEEEDQVKQQRKRTLRKRKSPQIEEVSVEEKEPEEEEESEDEEPRGMRRKTTTTVNKDAKKETKKTKKRGKAKKQKKRKDNTTFRSNMHYFAGLVQKLKTHGHISERHLNYMDITPFGYMFRAFYDAVIKVDDFTKPPNMIQEILKTYSTTKKSFSFGGTDVELKPEDLATIFYLPTHGIMIKPYNFNRTNQIRENSEFYNRWWSDNKSSLLKKVDVYEAIQKCVQQSNDTACQDFVRLMIMMMFQTIFNPGSSYSIRVNFVDAIEDFQKISKIAWAKVIWKLLHQNLSSFNQENPLGVNTCSIALIYFFLEHTNFANQREEYKSEYPRFTKWNIHELHANTIQKKTDLKGTKDLTIVTEIEKALIDIPSVEPTPLKTEDSRQQTKRLLEENKKLTERNKRMKLKFKELSGKFKSLKGIYGQYDDRKNIKGLSDVELSGSDEEVANDIPSHRPADKEKFRDMVENEEDDEDNVEDFDSEDSEYEERNDESENDDDNDSDNDESEYEERNDESENDDDNDSDNNATAENNNTEDEMETKEDEQEEESDHNNEDKEKKEDEAAQEKEREEEKGRQIDDQQINSPEKQVQDEEVTKKEFEESDENKDEDKSDAPSKKRKNEESTIEAAEEQRSNIKRIKMRETRKRKLDPEFVYETKTRKKEVQTNDDDYIIIQETGQRIKKAKIPQPKPLQSLKSSPFYKNIKSKDKGLLQEFFETANTMTYAWSDNETTVLAKDINAVMMDAFISDSFIDCFMKIAVKKKKNKSNASWFPAATWGYMYNNFNDHYNRVVQEQLADANFSNLEYLFFPLNSTKTARSKEPYHWTLLVLDLNTFQWAHFNSSLPKSKANRYLNDATGYKERISKDIIRMKCLTQQQVKNLNNKIYVASCPQQGTSCGCAIYTCLNIKLLLEGKSPEEEDDKDINIGEFRAQCCAEILSDIKYGWVKQARLKNPTLG